MDPSSPYAMQRLIGMKDRFDVAFACDTDHDRHGIVTRSAGLLPPNHYLARRDRLSVPRTGRSGARDAAVGKTVVSSSMIDRVAARLGRRLYEVPVGFKWFVDGLLDGSLGFGGEESAGASFLRRDGTVWTTDKDGIVAGAAVGRDHRAHRPRSGRALSRARRASSATRSPTASTRRRRREQKAQLAGAVARRRSTRTELAGEPIDARARPRARQRRADRRHQGRSRRTAGSPRGRPAPRTSTRSTPRASAARSTSAHPGRGAGDRRQGAGLNLASLPRLRGRWPRLTRTEGVRIAPRATLDPLRRGLPRHLPRRRGRVCHPLFYSDGERR